MITVETTDPVGTHLANCIRVVLEPRIPVPDSQELQVFYGETDEESGDMLFEASLLEHIAVDDDDDVTMSIQQDKLDIILNAVEKIIIVYYDCPVPISAGSRIYTVLIPVVCTIDVAEFLEA